MKLPAEVEVTNDIASAMAGAQIVVGAVPAAYAREVYTLARPYWTSEMIVVSATKGLEPISHARISEVIHDVLGDGAAARVAVLSGPSFALEAARGEPTAVVVAGRPVLELTRVAGRRYSEPAGEVQSAVAGPAFRLNTTGGLRYLATEAKIELPIAEQVNAILNEGKAPSAAIRDVMERPSRRE